MISKREFLACVLGGLLLAISDRSFAVDERPLENIGRWVITGEHNKPS